MFLNPLMLLGALAVSVPVIIHLLNNRKFQRVRWAAMRFLRTSVERNRRRMRIEDLLLLLARCAIVLFLALALARPVFKRASAGFLGRSAVTAVLVIDNSASMSTTDGVSSRFELAKRAAMQVLDSMPGGSSVAVWTNADVPRQIIPEPTVELNLARAAIRDAALTDRATDLFPAVERAADMLSRRAGATKELYLITDGQLIGWKRLADVTRQLEASKQQFRTRLVLLGQAQDRNLSVTDLRQASGLSPADRPLRFQVDVSNPGAAAERDIRVKLYVNGGPLTPAQPQTPEPRTADSQPAVAEGVIDLIEPGKTRTTSLFARLPGEGYHTVTAAVEHDRVPADDQRTIAVRAVGRVGVLLVDGEPGRETRDSEVFFLRNALVPVSPAELDQYFIKVMTVSAPELAAQNFDDFDAIVLANVPDFSASALDGLTAFVQRGGGLIFFPGEQTDVAFFNDELFEKRKLLPAALGSPKGDADAQKPLLTLQDRNFEHPIAAIWNDPASGAPSSACFYRVVPIIEGSSRVVLRFSDGTPAAVEHPVGLGRVVLFASTADTAWNDLPVKPGVFVPLMYRVLGSIVARQDEGLVLRAGERFVFHPPADVIGHDAIIAAPLDVPGRAKQSRRVTLSGQRPTLDFDDTDLAGGYAVKIGEAPPIRFAVQPDPAESDLKILDEEQLKQLRSVGDVIEFERTPSLARVIEQSRIGKELWTPIAIAALVLAASEMVLAHWFSRPK